MDNITSTTTVSSSNGFSDVLAKGIVASIDLPSPSVFQLRVSDCGGNPVVKATSLNKKAFHHQNRKIYKQAGA